MPWNPYSKVRKDFCNFGDIIAFKLGEPCTAVQACGNDLAAHYTKINGNPLAVKWLACGHALVVIQVRRLKMFRGSKRYVWKFDIARASLQHSPDGTPSLVWYTSEAQTHEEIASIFDPGS